jgi:hypothetical protein
MRTGVVNGRSELRGSCIPDFFFTSGSDSSVSSMVSAAYSVRDHVSITKCDTYQDLLL